MVAATGAPSSATATTSSCNPWAAGHDVGVACPPSPDPDRFIEEGDIIKVGGVEMKVLHTPGHAPGHVVLVGDGFVIGGDVLFSGSIGRTDLPGGSFEQLPFHQDQALAPARRHRRLCATAPHDHRARARHESLLRGL